MASPFIDSFGCAALETNEFFLITFYLVPDQIPANALGVSVFFL